ncbi:unnamed protein product [Peniophora sp. CBMAI 1063]|nr:unnamed protein product [Peniophora sp. CBMAI 1063]
MFLRTLRSLSERLTTSSSSPVEPGIHDTGSNASAVEDASAEQLDTENQQCAQQTRTTDILDYKRRYNDSLPFVRPPDDVLIVIFLHLRDLRAACEPPALHVPEWVSITWVCHRFRALCLDYPLLWSYIGDYYAAWLREFTERSRPIPLDVDMHVDLHQRQSPSLERVLARQHRMRTLILDGEEFIMTFIVPLLLDSPTPELTTFCLRTHTLSHGSPYFSDEAMYDGAPGRSMSILLDAPCLRSLKLSGRLLAHIDPSSTLLPSSLEEIDIEGCYTAHELHTLLRGVPNIRSFTVRGAKMIIPRSSLTAVRAHAWTPLELPHLCSINIEVASDEHLTDLLLSLVVPSLRLTHLIFSDCDPHSDTAKVTGLLSAIRTLLTRSHGGARFQSLRLSSLVDHFRTADSMDRYCLADSIHMWHSSKTGTDAVTPYRQSTADALVTFKSQHSTYFRPILQMRNLSPFYRRLCEVFSLSDVRTLTIDTELAYSAQGWADIVRPLAGVEEIKFVDRHGRLAAALDALSLTPFVLPTLSRLVMCFGLRTSVTPPPLLEELSGVARTRRKGTERLRIAFEGCPRYLPALDEGLREIADVTWDNVGFFDDGNTEIAGPWLALISGL